MDDDTVLAMARAEREKLLKRLDAIDKVIRTYAPPTASAQAPVPHRREEVSTGSKGRDENRFTGMSETMQVLNAAEAYLRSKGPGARAQSSELYEAIIKSGVRINTPEAKKAKNRVAAALSHAKSRFFNERYRGYGLIEEQQPMDS